MGLQKLVAASFLSLLASSPRRKFSAKIGSSTGVNGSIKEPLIDDGPRLLYEATDLGVGNVTGSEIDGTVALGDGEAESVFINAELSPLTGP